MDKKLLMEIFSIPSQSGEEEFVRNFIIDFLRKYEISFETDNMGNVYSLEYPDKPLLNAHMDTVQDDVDEKLQTFAKIRGNILSGYGVIGADDKCGIYIILDLLRTNKFNFLFTVQEESGAIGAQYFESDKDFSHLPYGITLDRTGSDNILCFQNEYGTKEFEEALLEIGKSFGYKAERGLFSDADHLNDQISMCNLSVGYYSHHTKGEFVVINELENALRYTQSIIENLTQNFKAPDKHNVPYVFHGHYLEELEDEKEFYFMEKCFVTGKYTTEPYYIPSVDKYISKEGAYLLLNDLDESGLMSSMFEGDFLDTTYREIDDLDENFYKSLEKEFASGDS